MTPTTGQPGFLGRLPSLIPSWFAQPSLANSSNPNLDASATQLETVGPVTNQFANKQSQAPTSMGQISEKAASATGHMRSIWHRLNNPNVQYQDGKIIGGRFQFLMSSFEFNKKPFTPLKALIAALIIYGIWDINKSGVISSDVNIISAIDNPIAFFDDLMELPKCSSQQMSEAGETCFTPGIHYYQEVKENPEYARLWDAWGVQPQAPHYLLGAFLLALGLAGLSRTGRDTLNILDSKAIDWKKYVVSAAMMTIGLKSGIELMGGLDREFANYLGAFALCAAGLSSTVAQYRAWVEITGNTKGTSIDWKRAWGLWAPIWMGSWIILRGLSDSAGMDQYTIGGSDLIINNPFNWNLQYNIGLLASYWGTAILASFMLSRTGRFGFNLVNMVYADIAQWTFKDPSRNSLARILASTGLVQELQPETDLAGNPLPAYLNVKKQVTSFTAAEAVINKLLKPFNNIVTHDGKRKIVDLSPEAKYSLIRLADILISRRIDEIEEQTSNGDEEYKKLRRKRRVLLAIESMMPKLEEAANFNIPLMNDPVAYTASSFSPPREFQRLIVAYQANGNGDKIYSIEDKFTDDLLEFALQMLNKEKGEFFTPIKPIVLEATDNDQPSAEAIKAIEDDRKRQWLAETRDWIHYRIGQVGQGSTSPESGVVKFYRTHMLSAVENKKFSDPEILELAKKHIHTAINWIAQDTITTAPYEERREVIEEKLLDGFDQSIADLPPEIPGLMTTFDKAALTLAGATSLYYGGPYVYNAMQNVIANTSTHPITDNILAGAGIVMGIMALHQVLKLVGIREEHAPNPNKIEPLETEAIKQGIFTQSADNKVFWTSTFLAGGGLVTLRAYQGAMDLMAHTSTNLVLDGHFVVGSTILAAGLVDAMARDGFSRNALKTALSASSSLLTMPRVGYWLIFTAVAGTNTGAVNIVRAQLQNLENKDGYYANLFFRSYYGPWLNRGTYAIRSAYTSQPVSWFGFLLPGYVTMYGGLEAQFQTGQTAYQLYLDSARRYSVGDGDAKTSRLKYLNWIEGQLRFAIAHQDDFEPYVIERAKDNLKEIESIKRLYDIPEMQVGLAPTNKSDHLGHLKWAEDQIKYVLKNPDKFDPQVVAQARYNLLEIEDIKLSDQWSNFDMASISPTSSDQLGHQQERDQSLPIGHLPPLYFKLEDYQSQDLYQDPLNINNII